MGCEQTKTRLDDYVDGLLPQSERADVEAHVAACEECAAELGRLQELLAEAAALSRDRQPDRDLWPEIMSQIEELEGNGETNVVTADVEAPSKPRNSLRWFWANVGLYAAAAAILLALFAGYQTLWVTDETGSVDGVPRAAFTGAEQEYRKAKQALLEAIEERETYLDDTTVATIETNLDVIESAITEIHAAIQEDPQNRHLNEMLLAMYDQELEFLYQVSQIPISPTEHEMVDTDALEQSNGTL